MTDGPKRFYKEVSLLPEGEYWAVALDGRPARTVGRRVLAAHRSLAFALAEEWRSQEAKIDLATMPLTRLHGFVLDAGAEGKAQFIDTIVQYAGSDLLCYRADDDALAARQEALFGPFLKRAAEEGLAFEFTTGLLPIEQPAATLAGLRRRLEGLDIAEVFPRKLLTEILGSAVLALYADDVADAAFDAALVDETFQAERWGRDAEAETRRQALRRDFDDTLHYLALQAGA